MALDQITSQSIAEGAITVNDIADGSITHSKLHTTAIQDKLGYTPISPTQLTTEINNLIAGAPGALNTLDELAAALGDDANYAATITNALATKASATDVSNALATLGTLSTLNTITASNITNNTITPDKFITLPGTNITFKQCASYSDFVASWKYSGNAGARTSAPTTVASDPVISNFNYNTSSWTDVSANTIYTPNNSTENFYWYIRKLFYITAGSFTISGSVDDDHVLYLTPVSEDPILIGGNIADNDGSGATAWTYTVTVPTSGFYYLTARGVEGGGGDYLLITDITNTGNFWVASNNVTAGAVIQTVYNFTNSRTSWGGMNTVLETSIKPTSTASKILISGVLYGHASDDSYMYLEYKIGSGSWTKDATLNGDGYLGGWGDHCWSHMSNTGPFPSPFNVLFSPNTTQTVSIRVGVNAEATFYLNRGTSGSFSWDGSEGGNTNPNPGISKSTIILQEIAG
jgi:hypothetical protein